MDTFNVLMDLCERGFVVRMKGVSYSETGDIDTLHIQVKKEVGSMTFRTNHVAPLKPQMGITDSSLSLELMRMVKDIEGHRNFPKG